MTAVVVIEAVVIVLLVVLVAGLLKSHAEILRQLHALGAVEEGSSRAQTEVALRTTGFEKAPSTTITGVDVTGAVRSVSLDHGRGNTMLAFLSAGCSSCQVFWNTLIGEIELPTHDTRLMVITKGPDSESPAKISKLAPSDVDLIMSSEAWDEFRVPMTPHFLLLDPMANVIGEGSAPNWDHLIDLFRQSAADTTTPVRLNTEDREHFTDTQLDRSGIKPGDHSLYENPIDQ